MYSIDCFSTYVLQKNCVARGMAAARMAYLWVIKGLKQNPFL